MTAPSNSGPRPVLMVVGENAFQTTISELVLLVPGATASFGTCLENQYSQNMSQSSICDSKGAISTRTYVPIDSQIFVAINREMPLDIHKQWASSNQQEGGFTFLIHSPSVKARPEE